MASMGFLGAVKGGASGFSKFLSDEMAQERELRLQEIKRDDQRETNRLNAEARRETNKLDADYRNTLYEGREQARHANSMELERLRQAGDFAQDAVNRAYGGSSNDAPADVQTTQWLMANIEGLDAQTAFEMTKSRSQMAPAQWRAKLISNLMSGSMGYTAEQAGKEADAAMAIAFPEQPSMNAPSGIPKGAIDALIANPDLAGEFYKKYYQQGQ